MLVLTELHLKKWRDLNRDMHPDTFLIVTCLRLLEGRSDQEIVELADIFNQIWAETTKANKEPVFYIPPNKDIPPPDYSGVIPLHISDLYWLRECRSHIKLNEYTDKDYCWHELFAAHALDEMAEFEKATDFIIEVAKDGVEGELKEKLPDYGNFLVEPAIAMHISFDILQSDVFSEDDPTSLDRYAEQKVKLNAGLAAKKKYLPLNTIKNRFLAYRQSRKFRSNADAARQFYREISDADRRILCPTNAEEKAVRTLTDYLRKSQLEVK